MDYEYQLNEKKYLVSVNKKDDFYLVGVDDKQKEVKVEFLSSNSILIFDDCNVTRAFFARDNDKTYVNIKGNYFEIKEAGTESHAGMGQSDVEFDGIIYPPMPGKVIKILVTKDTEVKAGDGLIIVESMKMENELTAPAAGTVKEIHVSEGEQVNLGQSLIEIEIAEKTD